MASLLALWNGPVQTWGIVDIAIAVVVVAAIVGVVIVALRWFEVKIPSFVVTIFWIVVCAAIAIFAIRLIAGM